jgi:Tol biopolymer transport system component
MHRSAAAACTAGMIALAGPALPTQAAETTRVSLGPYRAQGNGASFTPAISGSVRFVAFASDASNLVPGDTNGASDIFVHDRQTATTTRVSVGAYGTQGNGASERPALSADGRYVAFSSSASNLVRGDTNAALDIFVHDRQTATTTRVSVGASRAQGNGGSFDPALSADGRFVTFFSSASNLVSGDTNGAFDIFVHDRQTGRTTRVSLGARRAQSDGDSFDPVLSADGRFVAFASEASNLVPGDTNRVSDVFVHDRQTGRTTRVSVGAYGTQGNDESVELAISANGRFVVFASEASNLVPSDTNAASDVFVHDRRTTATTRVSVGAYDTQGNGRSTEPAISGDGRFVAFASSASNLVPGDTNRLSDLFVHDRQTGTTTRVSLGARGTQGNEISSEPALSADGRHVAFSSDASNLVPGDTNRSSDVFVRSR